MISEEVKSAVARVDVYQGTTLVSRATGFLIARDVVVTTLRAIGAVRASPPQEKVVVPHGDRVQIAFSDPPTPATLIPKCFSEDDDWVLLRCDPPPPGIRALPLASVAPDDSVCLLRGFDAAGGKTFEGKVLDRGARLFRRGPALEITSDGAQGVPLSGLRGAPCLVRGAAVGVIFAAAGGSGPNDSAPIAGALYAHPLEQIVVACREHVPELAIRSPIRLDEDQFGERIAAFLQSELLADQYLNLDHAGSAKADRLALARVFVDLPVGSKSLSQWQLAFVATMLRASDASPAGFAEMIEQEHWFGRVSLNEPKSMHRVVLVGGPGQGKSTLGQFLCQVHRAHLLAIHPSLGMSDEAREACEEFETQRAASGIATPIKARFPIRVVLRDFAACLAKPNSPIDTLLSFIESRIRLAPQSSDLHRALKRWPWLIVLDGLDEVPASSNRGRVMQAIADFSNLLATLRTDAMIIATTRPQGYSGEFSMDQYLHLPLAPLSQERARGYAERLLRHRYHNNSDEADRVLGRIDQSLANPETAKLMETPLQVAIMATLLAQIGAPPSQRWRLLTEYYQAIYRRELQREISASEILEKHRAAILAIHMNLGLMLQVESEREGRTDAKISSERLGAVVEARLREDGHEGEKLAELKDQIVAAATERLVFLVGVDGDHVAFEIRTLQEFMAAEALMVMSREHRQAERLRAIARSPYWRNVFLFAAGKCFEDVNFQWMRDSVVAIARELDDPEIDVFDGLGFAGASLAAALLREGVARTQPVHARSLSKIALGALELAPGRAHVELAEAYQKDAESVYAEAIEASLTRDARRSLGAWRLLGELGKRGVDWAIAMIRARWPEDPERAFEALCEIVESGMEETSIVSGAERALRRVPVSRARSVRWWSDRRPTIIAARFGAARFAVVPLSFEHRRQLRPPRHADHPSWSASDAAEDFTLSPGSKSLATALRAIANSSDPAAFLGADPRFGWPLDACLAASESFDDVHRHAERAERGELGDLSDWAEAEKRWGAAGLTLADADMLKEERWPFDRSIAQTGFPFAGCMLFFDSDPAEAERLLEAAEGPSVRAQLANVLGAAGYLSRNFDVAAALFSSRRMHLRTFLNVLGIAELARDRAWIELFDRAGRRDWLNGYFSITDDTRSILAGALARDPQLHGILNVLSWSEGAGDSVPIALCRPHLYEDPMIREAAIVCAIQHHEHGTDHERELARSIVDLTAVRPRAIGRALEHVEPRCASLIEAIAREARSAHLPVPEQLIALLRSGAKPGGLGTRHAWRHLRLPPSLEPLLFDIPA